MPGVYPEAGGYLPPGELPDGWSMAHDRAIVNVGSVGQPRDGDVRACYCLLDDEGGQASVIFRRVDYDVDTTVAAIRANPYLDDHLAERLARGR